MIFCSDLISFTRSTCASSARNSTPNDTFHFAWRLAFVHHSCSVKLRVTTVTTHPKFWRASKLRPRVRPVNQRGDANTGVRGCALSACAPITAHLLQQADPLRPI